MRRALGAIIALGTLASGCASDVDLSGNYLVQAASFSSPCGTDEQGTSTTMLLKFTAQLSWDFTYTRCTDAAGTACPDEYFNWFNESVDDGWRGTYGTAGSASDTTCGLSFREQTATLHDGRLVLDTRIYSDEVELPFSLCTDEEATRRGTSLRQCFSHERLEAIKQ